MKTFQTLFVLAALCVVTSAFAAPPRPPADCGIDNDKDGWCVPDQSRLDAAGKPGFHIGALDCNDADPAVNPAAREKLGDGIDNDCDGNVDMIVPAYAKNFGCSATSVACLKKLDAEVTVCAAATGQCAVNYTAGKFVTSFGNYFVDTDCNGVREVLDQAAKDAYDAKVRQGHRCVKASEKASAKKAPAKKAPAKKAPAKKAPEKKGADAASDPDQKGEVTELDKKIAGLAEDVTKTAARVDGAEKRLGQVETVLADSGKRIDGLDKALAAEAKAREEGDAALGKRIDDHDSELQAARRQIADVDDTAQTARRTALAARTDADTALRSGVSAGVGVGYFVKGQQGVALHGKTLRGGSAHATMLSGFVGADLPTVLLRGVAGVGLIGKEGSPDGGGLISRGGVEALLKLGTPVHAVGVGVGYLGHLSGGKVSGASAESRGGYAELIYELSPLGGDGNVFRVPIRASIGGGYEALGTRGSSAGGEFKADGHAPFVMFSLSVGGGVGPHLR